MDICTRSGYIRLFFSTIILFFFIVGCQKTVLGTAPHSQPGSSSNEVKPGPPAHAPAYGYRAKHQYRYYPNCEVYYDTGRRLWFYLSDGQWTAGVSLPGSIRLDSEYVTLELNTERPYEQHEQQLFKNPGKGKKKKK